MFNRLLRKLFPQSKSSLPVYNIIKGDGCIIDPTSILTTSTQSIIKLNGNNYIGRNVEIGASGLIDIGEHTTIQDRCILLGDIEIGNYCTFAPNVYISSGRHYYNIKPNLYIRNQDEFVANDSELSKQHSKKVTIGDDCWLGINSVIMSGLSIGRGCVIGANSVVTKNLEPFSVVAGAPAKLIKKRLDFIPKTLIKFDEENDLPNFYKGFFLDVNNLTKHKILGGIATSYNFICYLQNNTNQITINIKKLVPHSITISYNNQSKNIDTNEFINLTFKSNNRFYHEFTIQQITDKQTNCALIKSVEVSN